ncbi:hypothetical protein [Georgenia faecalis]|uniref:Secreted protein n=1 Tax=Georgenia faecalis TaxID=2483799 RepID=A0ABV9D9W6_9MICO|nr:hypothetical protein [Georgenia faecalis]
MDLAQFAASYWWLVFPFSGLIAGGVQGLREWDDRRRRDRLEMARIKYGQVSPSERPAALGAVTGDDVRRLIAEHDGVEQRWRSYELDVAKLIDYPMMTDMREALTVEFHRAKRHADGLRPAAPKELKDPDRYVAYRTAVTDLAVAFDVLEGEARRRRTTTFTDTEREALRRAKQLLALAEDRAATHAERQSAYRRAMRELEGLVVVPEEATDAMERRIAGALGGSPAGPGDERPERGADGGPGRA